MGIATTDELKTEYTDIDLNSTGTTDLYTIPSDDVTDGAVIEGVYLKNGGGAAVVQLEVTDGSSTAVLTPGQSGGDSITFTGGILLGGSDKLQANVTTAEGSSQTNTAAVGRGNRT